MTAEPHTIGSHRASLQTPERLFVWYLADPSKPVWVGEVGKKSNGDATLEYAPSWLADGFAISDDMPLRSGTWAPNHRRLRQPGAPGAMDDALPDRWGEKVVRYLYKRGASLRDYLWFAGDERFGALGVSCSDRQYLPFNKRSLPRLADVQELSAAAAMIESGGGDLGQERRALVSAGASLGGAKPKAVIAVDAVEWVIKFFNAEPWDQPLVEHACMTLARKAGINTATTQMISLTGENAVAIRRFDRVAEKRIHSISASTLIRSATPHGEEPQYGYPQLARRLRIMADVESMQEQLQELFRRMVFNILTGNTDDHEKNHALVYSFHNGRPRLALSPAYDVVTTGSGAYDHEFMIADGVNAPDLDAALGVHADFGLSQHQASDMLASVVKVVDSWKDHFTTQGVTPTDIARLGEFIDAPHLLVQRKKHRSARSPSAKRVYRPRRGTPGIFR